MIILFEIRVTVLPYKSKKITKQNKIIYKVFA